LARLSSLPRTHASGDGSCSRSSRRVPAHIAFCCASASSSTRTSTESPASTSAGKATTSEESSANSRGSGPSGHSRRPVRSSPRAARDSLDRVRGCSRARRASRSLSRPRTRPSSSSTEKVTRRWSGTSSGRQACTGTGTPVSRCSSWPSFSTSGRSDGSMRARAALARSGAGMKLRRSCLGSDRISAVASSSRSPGTCQSKPRATTWLSDAIGMCTVTPSTSLPGSNT
jgi:hypothetical protein